MGMSLHIVLFYSALDVVNDQFSFVVNGSYVTDAHRRCLKSGVFDTEFFLPFAEELQTAPVELIDIKDSFGGGALT